MADKKKTLAEMIRGSVGEASIAAMDAQAVPESGTGREQITYIPRTALVADERNFYSIEGIDELAANIATVGLLEPLRVRPIEGEDGLPASSELILADVRAINDGSVKLDALRALAVALAEEDDAPDHMLIDCPPSFTAATSAALAAADDVIIPIKLDRFSLDGVRELLRQIAGMHEINPSLRVAGVLVTMYDGTTVAKETADALAESAIPIFGTSIKRSTAVDRSTFERKPLRELPGTYAKLLAEQYAAVVDEYLRGGSGI